MEDRETGASAPEAGASRSFLKALNGAENPQAGRIAGSPSRDGAAGGPHPKHKKRRKRKRGRKVFARDGERPGSGSQGAIAGSPPSVLVEFGLRLSP